MPTPKRPLTITQAQKFLLEHYGLEVVRQTIFMWIKKGLFPISRAGGRVRLPAERIRTRWVIQECHLRQFLTDIL